MTILKLALRGAGCGAWLLVAVGCSSSASNTEDFVNQFVGALCHSEAQCGSVGASEEARCREVTAVGYGPDLEAVAAKRLSFDSGAAGRCLDAIKGSGCRLPELIASLNGACDKVFTPQVAVGGICKNNGECIGGTCNAASVGCAGTCVAYVATGGTCDFAKALCAPTDVCDASHTCVARGAIGAACHGASSCKEGLGCRGYMAATGAAPEVVGTCAAPGKVGDPCTASFLGSDCSPELYCDGSETPSKCAALLPKDAECLSSDSCAAGLACVGLDSATSAGKGMCESYVDIGAACTSGVEPSNCPTDADCDPTSKVCVVTGALGSDCKTKSVRCSSGTYCDEMSGTCTVEKKLGEACSTQTSDEPCAQGLCDPTTKTCAYVCM